ncbi:MAG: hypothetical protein Q9191_000254 [Dirinaria sp. TL-2023a]
MIIPTRTRSGRERRTKVMTPKTLEKTEDEQVAHDPEAIPSSMAAWLALISLPTPQYKPDLTRNGRSKSGSRSRLGEITDTDDCENTPPASSFRSWSMLMSPSSDLGLENNSVVSDTTYDAASFVRSISNDSVPSLYTDYGSSPSTSGFSTPGTVSRSRRGTPRKQKELSSSITEDCLLDHPLLPRSPTEALDRDASETDASRLCMPSPPPVKAMSSFKSNLTASLGVLRSAARSFSGLVSREEYLTRSMLPMTPPFTDERRPLPSLKLPDPALRRYLNPSNVVSPELHLHHESPRPYQARSRCTASIQLQTYERVPQPSSKASAPPIFASASNANEAVTVAADEPYSTPSPRPREIRENSDFLRVIVLEMNMRRSGRMNDATPGRAKMWLPARQVGKSEEEEREDGVPKRWLGQTE